MIVAVSAFESDEIMERAKKAGISKFLSKPATLEKLSFVGEIFGVEPIERDDDMPMLSDE